MDVLLLVFPRAKGSARVLGPCVSWVGSLAHRIPCARSKRPERATGDVPRLQGWGDGSPGLWLRKSSGKMCHDSSVWFYLAGGLWDRVCYRHMSIVSVE